MDFGEDDEILQDFLVEAGEIIELLGEQLVELEQKPEDTDLLNAVFRGFHTVKGGAGFLNIVQMIDVCHRAEDVFNVLRQGERAVDPDLMDAVLKVLDILNEQFEQLNNGETPVAAEPALLRRLENFAKPGATAPAAVAEVTDNNAATDATVASESTADGNDISEEEFESLLDALDGEDKETSASAGVTVSGSDDITEDEFEALLDEIQGTKGSSADSEQVKDAAPAAHLNNQASKTADSASSNEITEEEFENILDEIHGKGQIDTAGVGSDTAPAQVQTAAQTPVLNPTPNPVPNQVPAQASKPAVVPGAAVAQLKPAMPASTVDSDTKNQPAAAAVKENVTKGKPPTPRNSEATVRVDTKRLDDIMNMVGELVLVRNRLDTLKVKMNDAEVTKAVANLDIVTSDLQAAVMKTRMQPIKKVFGRFPRVVRDLARSLNKEVNLELIGEETDLDKNLVEALADPMVHLVRNSVDHGIEMPADREKVGKKRAGTITLSAAQEGDHILLTIEDDGSGMDAGVLRAKAVENGVLDEDAAARLDDREAYSLIFAPGFSTKSEISDISGRGVGMDVVKTRISQLNGTIDIDSEKGRGTRISIKLPLTLAILPTLMVKVGDRTFALPLSSVNEIFSIDTYNTNTVDGQLVIMVRKKAMPLFYLYKWLAHSRDCKADINDQVVVANVGNQKVGFVVNQVVGQEEVVIKPLGALLHGLPGFAGATITGDGRIALILDIPSLMRARANTI